MIDFLTSSLGEMMKTFSTSALQSPVLIHDRVSTAVNLGMVFFGGSLLKIERLSIRDDQAAQFRVSRRIEALYHREHCDELLNQRQRIKGSESKAEDKKIVG